MPDSGKFKDLYLNSALTYPASTCSRPNFRVPVPVAGTEQCGRPPSHQDETSRKAATEKLHQ